MGRERRPRLVEPEEDDPHFDAALRPKRFSEFVGQTKHKENLRVFVEAARQRKEALDHVLLGGPAGLGKTTLAHILAEELGVQLHQSSAPAIDHKGTLAGLLTKLERRDVLFIDEIHRLSPIVEENLYPAMEDHRIDVVTGDGPHAVSVQLPIKPFTLVGATTRTGLLTAPLLSRFGITIRLGYYPPEDLVRIVRRSAGILSIPIDDDACEEIARRARGTPRVANRLLRRVRDFAEVRGAGSVDLAGAKEWLACLEVDEAGLDEMDRAILRTIIEKFDGGPVGIETLAAALSEPTDTVEYVYEPYLLQEGYLQRTPRGRTATRRAYEHLGIEAPRGRGQGTFF